MTYCVFGADCCVYDSATNVPGLSLNTVACEGCQTRIVSTLNKLRLDYVDLSQMIPKASVVTEEQIFRPKPESSPPINMAAFTLRAQLAYFVCLVATIVRGRLDSRQAPVSRLSMREGFALDHDIRYLVERPDVIAGLPGIEHYFDEAHYVPMLMDGPGMCAQLLALHRRSRAMCGLEPRTVRLPGACPNCHLMGALRRMDDDVQRIWCAACRYALSADGYAAAMSMQMRVGSDPSGA